MKVRIVLAGYFLLLAFSFVYVPFHATPPRWGEDCWLGYAFVWERNPFQKPFDPIYEYKQEVARENFIPIIEPGQEAFNPQVELRNPNTFRQVLPQFKNWTDGQIRRAWTNYDERPRYPQWARRFRVVDRSRLLLGDLFLTAVFGAAFIMVYPRNRRTRDDPSSTGGS